MQWLQLQTKVLLVVLALTPLSYASKTYKKTIKVNSNFVINSSVFTDLNSEFKRSLIQYHLRYLLFKANEYNQNENFFYTPLLQKIEIKEVNTVFNKNSRSSIPSENFEVNELDKDEFINYYLKKIQSENLTKTYDIIIEYKAKISFLTNKKNVNYNQFVLPNDPFFIFKKLPKTSYVKSRFKFKSNKLKYKTVCTSLNESSGYPFFKFWYYWSPYRTQRHKNCINILKKNGLLADLKIQEVSSEININQRPVIKKRKTVAIFVDSNIDNNDTNSKSKAYKIINSILSHNDFGSARSSIRKHLNTQNVSVINFATKLWTSRYFYKSELIPLKGRHIAYQLVPKKQNIPSIRMYLINSKDREYFNFFNNDKSDIIAYLGHSGHGSKLNSIKMSKKDRVYIILSCFSKSYLDLNQTPKSTTTITTGTSFLDIGNSTVFKLINSVMNNEKIKPTHNKVPLFVDRGVRL